MGLWEQRGPELKFGNAGASVPEEPMSMVSMLKIVITYGFVAKGYSAIFFNPHLWVCLLILEREHRGEREREKH